MSKNVRGVRRRDFLVWSAAGALTPWLGGVAFAAEPAVEAMSVGFVEGSDTLPRLRGTAWRRIAARSGESDIGSIVVPARSLILGDQQMATETVKIRIQGLYPRLPAKTHVVSADLDVLFPPPDPAANRSARYQAWSFRTRPVPSASPPVGFPVPLGIDGKLLLVLTVTTRERAVLTTRRYRARFTVDWEAGIPKLQRGIYLLGFTPVWEKEVALPPPGGEPRMDLLSIAMSVERLAAP
jgi:hypothetical protein